MGPRAYNWWDCVVPILKLQGIKWTFQKFFQGSVEADRNFVLYADGVDLPVSVQFDLPDDSTYSPGFILGYARESDVLSILPVDQICSKFKLPRSLFDDCDVTAAVFA